MDLKQFEGPPFNLTTEQVRRRVVFYREDLDDETTALVFDEDLDKRTPRELRRMLKKKARAGELGDVTFATTRQLMRRLRNNAEAAPLRARLKVTRVRAARAGSIELDP